jgi:hypothetical protein
MVVAGALAPDDLSLFLKLHQSFLVYVAQQTGIAPSLRTRDDYLALSKDTKFKIADVSLSKENLLREFVESNPFNFTIGEIEIVRSWKHHVKGNFFIVKLTREGAIFLEEKEKGAKAYLVLPLVSPFEEVLPLRPPLRAEAVLLPFKGRIVYDGWLRTDQIYFGGGMSRSIRAACDDAIISYGLVRSYPFSPKGKKEYTDEEKLVYYLKTRERREEHCEQIDEILHRNPGLFPIYHREMGRVNSGHLTELLRNVGVVKGWFAAAGDVIVASGTAKDEVQKGVEAILPKEKRGAVHVFELTSSSKA